MGWVVAAAQTARICRKLYARESGAAAEGGVPEPWT